MKKLKVFHTKYLCIFFTRKETDGNMEAFEERNNIVRFFRQIKGRDFVKCEEKHFCADDLINTSKNLKEVEACCFGEIISHVFAKDREEAIALCGEWTSIGLGATLCSMIESENFTVKELCEQWKKIDWIISGRNCHALVVLK